MILVCLPSLSAYNLIGVSLTIDWSISSQPFTDPVPQSRCCHHRNTLFQQHKRRLYIWSCPGGQHWNQIDYSLRSQRWRSSIQPEKTRLGADCCSDHELLIAKFRLKLNKVGKTIRPFRYDLNKIPSDYTVDMRNRIRTRSDRESAWWTMEWGSWHFTGDRNQDHSQEKEMQKSKMAVWGGLMNSCENKRSAKQRRKGKIYSFECRVPKNSKER